MSIGLERSFPDRSGYFDRHKTLSRFMALCLLSAALGLNIAGLYRVGHTSDEWQHYLFGKQWAQAEILERRGHWEANNLPFIALNTFPEHTSNFYELIGLSGRIIDLLNSFNTARIPTALFSFIFGLYLFRWSKALYGASAGLFSLVLFVLEPNLQAHSQLVTGDIYGTGMMMIAVFYFWKYLNKGGKGRLAKASFVLALSQLSKYTCLFLYPIFGLIVLAKKLPSIVRAVRQRRTGVLTAMAGKFAATAVLMGVVSLFIINTGFFFKKSFVPLSDFKFESKRFLKFQANAGFAKDLPVPLPYAYVNGLDVLLLLSENSWAFGNIYLLGTLQTKRPFKGFPGYYAVAALYKVPCATLALILAALYFYVRRGGFRRFLEKEVFLFVPVLVLSVYFNFFNSMNIGVRYFMGVFPFFLVFCGYPLSLARHFPRPAKIMAAILLVYQAVSVLSYFPYYLSYMNELVWDRKMGYRVLADSNLDWGQGNEEALDYARKHPKTLLNPDKPVSGDILVSINQLVGVFDSERFRWLRENFVPVGHVGYSHLLFRVSKDGLRQIKTGERNRTPE